MFPLQVDSIHHFRLVFGGVTLVLVGRIAHCKVVSVDPVRVEYETGIEFIEPSPRLLAIIDDFVRHLRKMRSHRLTVVGASPECDSR
jgi:hypothetical protein